MNISPYAGKPAEAGMLTDIPRLVTAYYVNRLDPAVPASAWPSDLRPSGFFAEEQLQ